MHFFFLIFKSWVNIIPLKIKHTDTEMQVISHKKYCSHCIHFCIHYSAFPIKCKCHDCSATHRSIDTSNSELPGLTLLQSPHISPISFIDHSYNFSKALQKFLRPSQLALALNSFENAQTVKYWHGLHLSDHSLTAGILLHFSGKTYSLIARSVR